MKTPETKEKKFYSPPKLPIKWICATLIMPIIVVVLPFLLNSNSLVKDRVIVALSLLSLSLLILCIAISFQLYSEAYTRQIFEFKLDALGNDYEELNQRIDELEKEKQNYQSDNKPHDG